MSRCRDGRGQVSARCAEPASPSTCLSLCSPPAAPHLCHLSQGLHGAKRRDGALPTSRQPSPAWEGLAPRGALSEAGTGSRAPLRAGVGKAGSGRTILCPSPALRSSAKPWLRGHLCVQGPGALAGFKPSLSAGRQGDGWLESLSQDERGLEGWPDALTRDLSRPAREALGAASDMDAPASPFLLTVRIGLGGGAWSSLCGQSCLRRVWTPMSPNRRQRGDSEGRVRPPTLAGTLSGLPLHTGGQVTLRPSSRLEAVLCIRLHRRCCPNACFSLRLTVCPSDPR